MLAGEAAWKRLVEFTTMWHGPLTDEDAVAPALMEQAERRLGLRLPAALRRWYGLVGRRAKVTHVQDELLAPQRLMKEERVLVIRAENQWVVRWGVGLDRISDDDPPVLVGDDGKWEFEAPHLSTFALQVAIYEAVIGAGHAMNGPATADAVGQFRQHLRPLDVPPWTHWPDGGTQFYGDDTTMAFTNGPDWIWVASLEPARLASLRAVLPIEWEYSSE